MFSLKNHVGRPSNEELTKRRRKKVFMILCPVLVVIVFVVLITNGNLSNLMGNSVSNYYCLDGADYKENKCIRNVKESAYKIGDIDKSGDITIQDATILQRYLNKNYYFDSQQIILADCDGDGEITSSDVDLLQQYIANITPGQRIEVGAYSLVNKKSVCAVNYDLVSNECIKTVSVEPLLKDKYKNVKYAYYLGDINRDDDIDARDYLYLSSYLSNSNMYSLDEEQLFLADMNNDLVIDKSDLVLLEKYLNGNVDKKRICKDNYKINNSYCVIDNDIIYATDIKINKTSEKLGVGDTSRIIATVEPSNVTDKTVIYESSDEKVAIVSNEGLVTAKKEGNAVITVKTKNNKKAVYKLTVVNSKDAFCDKLISDGATYLDYKTFKDKFPNDDDYYAIKATHDCANKYGLDIKVSKSTYHIYKLNDESINVQTNTDLGGSNIYIHDETGAVTKNIVKEKNGEQIVKNVRDIPIYRIDNTKLSDKNTPKKLSNVHSKKVIPELKGKGYSLVIIENDKKQVFKRSGKNEKKDSSGNTKGDNAKDAFRIDNNGTVLDKLFWDYDNISSVTIYPISSDNLLFENGNFYTIVDNSDLSLVEGYVKRGMLVKRSNTTINNIQHAYVSKKGDSSYDFVKELKYRYNGFYRFSSAADITFKNSKVYSVNGKASETGESFYDFMMDDVVNAQITGIKMYDYQNTNEYFKLDNNQLNNDSWGVNGTNRCKEIVFDDCVLNRIDAHRGIYDLTVKNSIIGNYGIHVVGFGSLNIENVKVMYTNQFIVLRPDYGSLWDGKVTVKNSEIIPSNDDDVFLIKFKVTYDEDGKNKGYVHNYGYDLHLPDVNVNTLKVSSNAAKFSIFRNNNYSTNNTNLKIYNNGKLSNIKSKYVKNNSFDYYYPASDKINYKNISGDNSSMKILKYYKKISD